MIYGLIIFTGSIIARITGLFNRKTAKFFMLRKAEIKRISGFFVNRKERKEKVIWFHSASAGEFEQAKPVLEYIKEKHPAMLITASFFSPSGYEAALKYDKIDFCFNLPLDYKKNVGKMLNSIRPDIIIFSKYDVWRNLAVEAGRRGVKLVLISATLPGKSRRYRFPARCFFSKAYSSLEKIYAISEEDAQRFRKIRRYQI
jgi:3-deoxy-D-manno-octulosonic-acid transferase